MPLDEAYIAGLMLDCGAIFVAERMLEKYDAVFQMRYERPIPSTGSRTIGSASTIPR